MLKGKTLVEMAQTLEDLRANARDFVVPVERMKMDVIETEDKAQAANVITFPNGDGNGQHAVVPNKWAGRQIANYCDIPGQYYDRLASENPKLLSDNVNHGLAKGHGEDTRMLRTYKGQMRACLSSKFRRMDSYDLLNTAMPVMIENEFTVESSELTEKRFYMKAVTAKVQGEVKKGDVVQYGLVISSSDVGAGSLRIEPLIYRLACLNGMVSSHTLRKFHIGRDQAESDVYELVTDETRQLTDAAFWAQVRDMIISTMKPENFERELNRLRLAAELPIKNFNIPEVVELAAKALGTAGQKEVQENIVAYLANGADGAGLTKWGLINGFTWAAQQKGMDYDNSVELERAASKILDLPANQWRRITEAA